MPNTHENLGPAERIIGTLLNYTDHMVHNRPGLVAPDGRFAVGVRWEAASHRVENGQTVVYRLVKAGNKSRRLRVGVLQANGTVLNGGPTPVGEYRPAGLFPEVAVWFYRQIAEVWQLDNEFAARWASYQFPLEHRDLKVALAAFMLCQSRKGDPVRVPGHGSEAVAALLYDDDFRDVGEAMCLLLRADTKDARKYVNQVLQGTDRTLNPKLLLRIYELLTLPAVAAINRELGFGRSTRHPFLGRWPKVVEKWLQHRERNPQLLAGLIKAGFRQTVMALAVRIGYKPETPQFFEALRWRQKQAKDGRRTLAIGAAVAPAATLQGQTEEQVCQYILREKPAWKQVASQLPKELGVTRAIMAAAIEAGDRVLGDKDLIILTPTLEALGLMEVQEVRERWNRAARAADDMRAANIARNVKSHAIKEQLQQAADTALQTAVAEVIKGLRVYFIVDISGSMHDSMTRAMELIARFVQAFPLAQLHVSVFNTGGRELTIRQASAAGVELAFRGLQASGGTDYRMGIRVLANHKPQADEDTLMIFVGDEGNQAGTFEEEVKRSGLRPMAFGLVFLESGDSHYHAVTRTATVLGIPCFQIQPDTFADPYAIPRTVRALVAATPVGVLTPQFQAPRLALVEQILATELLQKPAWA